ncbi:MAG: oxygen-independent coproporphyrinogen III oxidase-like protein [Oxalobacter sp.]|nr:oxygen-independent coproporphyrinogen III oxidase-like protein [Oxalobacter sp.]
MNQGQAVAPQGAGKILPLFSSLPPLALYIHIPWCIRKCPYCDFYSNRLTGELDEDGYIAVLKRDIEEALPLVWGRPIISVFIGGGTPSLFSAEGIGKLLKMVHSSLPIQPNAEISMEANPGTFETEKFKAYRDVGINRLSIGVQSFNPEHLKVLGRIHGREEALAAAKVARACFDQVNLDLMLGLPGQTLAQFQEDVKTAVSLDPTHLSLYQLTIEPNTPFAAHPPALPDEDVVDEMQSWMEKMLPEMGYQHYEVSAWAKPGCQCRHNSNYWLYGDYLGVGAAAHSKLTFSDGRIVRRMCVRNPDAYMKGDDKGGTPFEETFEVSVKDRRFEFMMNALRFINGFPTRLFEERTGLPLASISDQLQQAESKGLLKVSPATICPTPLGMRFLNDLQEIFLPD